MHRNSDLLIAANSRTKNTLLWKVPTAVAKQTTSKSVNPLPPPRIALKISKSSVNAAQQNGFWKA